MLPLQFRPDRRFKQFQLLHIHLVKSLCAFCSTTQLYRRHYLSTAHTACSRSEQLLCSCACLYLAWIRIPTLPNLHIRLWSVVILTHQVVWYDFCACRSSLQVDDATPGKLAPFLIACMLSGHTAYSLSCLRELFFVFESVIR